jgi:hypothetical protein
MISPQSITRVTAIALTAGAIAAPVASAYPPRTAPSQGAAAVGQAHQPTVASYTRQDKQLAPSSPSQPAVNAAPASAPAGSPSGGFDWADAGIGAAGGLAISIVGIGGALALSQRRVRRTRPTAVAAG